MTSNIGNAPQIQIRFTTKQKQYIVPDCPLTIPSSAAVNDLNTFVNELLNEANPLKQELEFDFFVESEEIKASLIEHLAEKNIPINGIIEIEYIRRPFVPDQRECLVHDDWVSSVCVNEHWILSGCFDDTLHLWSADGGHQLTIPGHTAPVKDVAWISLDEDQGAFVSVSHDHSAILWEWNISENSIECVYICKGHEAGIESVGINPFIPLMATGSTDCNIKIWSSCLVEPSYDNEEDEEPSETSNLKKPKISNSEIREPIFTLRGHKEAVSSVLWTDNTEILSSSWDYSFKVWDAETGQVKTEMLGNKCFFDIDYSPLSQAVLTAAADKTLRLYDLRATDSAKLEFESHTQWVQCVQWSKIDENLFVSGGYDNAVKIWDTRNSTTPIFELLGHEDKVLDCSWVNSDFVATAGADNTVRTFNTK